MLLCKHIAAYPGRYLELFKAPHNGEKDTLREFVNVVKQLTGPKGIKFNSEDDRNKFKGDVLEVLAEIFFNLSNCNLRISSQTTLALSPSHMLLAKVWHVSLSYSVAQP